VKLRVGDRVMIGENFHGAGKVGTITENLGLGLLGIQVDGSARLIDSNLDYAYYPEELAKGIADTKIARKLYENKIEDEKDGLIFIRLEDL